MKVVGELGGKSPEIVSPIVRLCVFSLALFRFSAISLQDIPFLFLLILVVLSFNLAVS